jgi:ribosome recycling factor
MFKHMKEINMIAQDSIYSFEEVF